jgi:hypothetical protein
MSAGTLSVGKSKTNCASAVSVFPIAFLPILVSVEYRAGGMIPLSAHSQRNIQKATL